MWLHFDNSATDLYISGVPYHAEDRDLFLLARVFGTVIRLRIVRDRVTDRGMGFAFIRFASESDACRARRALDGIHFAGRVLHAQPVRQEQQGKSQP